MVRPQRTSDDGQTRRQCRRRASCLPLALLSIVALPCAAAAQTRAGTAIDNVARVDYRIGDAAPATTPSNNDRLIVAERLDVALAGAVAATIAVADGQSVWPVTLRNTGNGQEAFALEFSAPAGVGLRIAIDVDGDGRFDATRDRLLDVVSPLLAPGESAALLVLVTPATAGSGAGSNAGSGVTLVARAVTGSGTPGTVFAARGDGGGDAVVGPTGATARVSLSLAASDNGSPQLVKSQAALAPDGSTRAVSGTVVTYTLEARFAGPTPAARIADAVPAGTRLVPGSLQLDGTALSDAADGDAGTADSAGVVVDLGDIPGPAIRRVQFKVQIQ